ncbi:MAG: class II glutamine amidotransferase [Segetibacter sp.]
MNRLGKLNVLLSDGHRLFCYHDTGGWKGLNFRALHVRDHQTRHFEDASLAIDVEAKSANHGFVVATQPLGEQGWHPFRTGELIVFERGSIRFSSHRNHRVSEFSPGPREGHLGPAIVPEPTERDRAGAHDEDHALV